MKNYTMNNTVTAVRTNGARRWVHAASLFNCVCTGWQVPMTVQDIRNSRMVMLGDDCRQES